MLQEKTLFALINGSAGCTGQNTLYYNPSTKVVRYTTVPLRGINAGTATSIVDTFTDTTTTGTTYVTYNTSATLPAGIYFVTVSYNYTGTGGGEMRVQLRNNQSGTTFGNYGVISIQQGGILAGGSSNALSTLASSSTFSFQFLRTTGSTVTIRGASLACFRVA